MNQYLFWGVVFSAYGILRVTVVDALDDNGGKGMNKYRLWRFPLWILLWPLLVKRLIDRLVDDMVKE